MEAKTLINIAKNIRESDIEEIVKMESDLIKDGFKKYAINEAKQVYSAYIAMKEYYKIKKILRKEDNKRKYDYRKK